MGLVSREAVDTLLYRALLTPAEAGPSAHHGLTGTVAVLTADRFITEAARLARGEIRDDIRIGTVPA